MGKDLKAKVKEKKVLTAKQFKIKSTDSIVKVCLKRGNPKNIYISHKPLCIMYISL